MTFGDDPFGTPKIKPKAIISPKVFFIGFLALWLVLSYVY